MILAALPAFFPGAKVYAADLESLVGAEKARALLAGEKPVLVQFKDPKLSLIPAVDELAALLGKQQNDLSPSVIVETLRLYNKPPEAERPAMSGAEETALFNEVLALSSLAGIQYFSASRGVMRTFYETSSVIDGPSSKKPLPDPFYVLPPSKLTIFARQKDLTFGDNIYQYDFYRSPGSLIFVQQNLTALTAGIIPAVGRNKLHSVVAVLDAGDQLLIYAVSMAKAASVPGMNQRVGDSFSNRVEAVIKWFSGQADKAFKKAHS